VKVTLSLFRSGGGGVSIRYAIWLANGGPAWDENSACWI